MTDQEGMQLALAEARQAFEENETPVGAVLVSGNKILARAHNHREAFHDPTAHAEILVLGEGAKAKGDWRLNDCTLYVTLEPCPMCAGAMVMSRLGRCVYGAFDPQYGCCGSVYDLPADPAFHTLTKWESGIEKEACETLLSDFFQDKR